MPSLSSRALAPQVFLPENVRKIILFPLAGLVKARLDVFPTILLDLPHKSAYNAYDCADAIGGDRN